MALKNPGVKFPPPLIFIGAFCLGLAVNRWLIATPLADAATTTQRLEVLGSVITCSAFGLMFWGMITFARSGTAIIPHRAASRLVRNGPYRFTRNPMYLGMILAYLGGVMILNTWWPLLFLPMALAFLVRFVVRREEAYLTDAFGAEYHDYQQQVRRFI